MTDRALSKKKFLMKVLSGSPADCMEAAKKIIGGQIAAEPATLAKIGRDKSLDTWQRLAAIYALGLIGEHAFAKDLAAILADPTDDTTVRSHAAEALGNLGNSEITDLLRDILERQPVEELRESCNYALQELGE